MFRLIFLFLFGYVALRIFEENKTTAPDEFELPDGAARPAKRGAGRRKSRPARGTANRATAKDQGRGTAPEASTNA